MNQIEINDQFSFALKEFENGINIFITGKAGTGKSTLLTYFRNNTLKNVVTLAPTGAAAVNIQGETIHSFFKFKPGTTSQEAKKIGNKITKSPDLFKAIDTIIIDEISMVRADLLDAIDCFLKAALKSKLPFAGKQVIFFGDLYQLAPVAQSDELKSLLLIYETPYFFSSNVIRELILNNNLKLIELEKIYRQSDQKFINFLNKIRVGEKDEDTLNTIKLQVLNENHKIDDNYIYLTSRNDQADIINSEKLSKINGKNYRYISKVNGDFNKSSYPTPEILELKLGARVMFLNNDPAKRWINGTLGNITSISNSSLMVKIDGNTIPIEVKENTWELSTTVFNSKNNSLERESIGSFTQIPLRLAWAITIHKSQGKTFDKVIIDLGRSAFALGQTYVALSRCRTIDGILLVRALRPSDIKIDKEITIFLSKLQNVKLTHQQSLEDKLFLLEKTIKENSLIKMLYLKGNNEEMEITIYPLRISKLEHNKVEYLGLRAYCVVEKNERIFNVIRILQINKI